MLSYCLGVWNIPWFCNVFDRLTIGTSISYHVLAVDDIHV